MDVALRTRLERALQNIPLHGERFRKVVTQVAGAFLTDPAEFVHPVGKADSTLVSFCVTNPIYIVFRDQGKLHVEPIFRSWDYERDGLGPYRVLQAAWSGDRLFTLLRWEGGTGNTDYGRVFTLRRAHWKMVQRMDTHGENAWEGDGNRRRIVGRSPVDISDTFLTRHPVDENRSHAGIHLNYRETWRFRNGRLWRSGLWRVQTPYATLCDIFRAVEHRQRRLFNLAVAPELRNHVWQALLKVRHTADNESSESRDETRHLEIDYSVWVTFSLRQGRWVITAIGRRSGLQADGRKLVGFFRDCASTLYRCQPDWIRPW